MTTYNPRYAAQLRAWVALCDVHHAPAELAAIEADQAQRVADTRYLHRCGETYRMNLPVPYGTRHVGVQAHPSLHCWVHPGEPQG